MQLLPGTDCKVIMACAVLHNIGRIHNLPMEIVADDEDEEDDIDVEEHANGFNVRNQLIRNRFT